jgi:hypothetical protein
VTFAALTAEGMAVAARAVSGLADAVRRRIVEPLGDEGFAALEETVISLVGPAGPKTDCPGSATH